MMLFSFFVILAIGQPVFQDSVKKKDLVVELYQVIIVLDEFDEQPAATRDFVGAIIDALLEKLKPFMHDWGHILIIKKIDYIELTKEGVKNEY